MVGGRPVLSTTNCVAVLVAALPAVTPIGPVVAPVGTVTVSWVFDADTIGADVPLKDTVLPDGEGLKPLPAMTTCVPATPWVGEKAKIASCPAGTLVICTRLPTIS